MALQLQELVVRCLVLLRRVIRLPSLVQQLSFELAVVIREGPQPVDESVDLSFATWSGGGEC